MEAEPLWNVNLGDYSADLAQTGSDYELYFLA
ncbi:hypothetical protein X953_14985 [Virgibacillus sp. SK37]|nr:hypothetical protein X953_14985 [Virgibacillus sp. SK37]